MARTTRGLEISLQFDERSALPLYQQLAHQLRQAILEGRLVAGMRLPSTRTLAEMLQVSRTVSVTAYDVLFAEGYLEGKQGSGTYVTGDLPTAASTTYSPVTPPRWLSGTSLPEEEPCGGCVHQEQMVDFRPGRSYLAPFPLRAWRQIWRQVASTLPPNRASDPSGLPELREALADYLRRMRGIVCQADDIVITAGTTQAIDLLARSLLPSGQAVGCEEPGCPIAREIFQACGASVLPLPVDEQGLRVEALPRGEQAPLLVYVTPSHQYPLAVRLSSARRLALLEWAEENDSLIVEDDYGSEFHFRAVPLPALASLDKTGRVAYIGAFSTVVTPALQMGYLVANPLLRERVVSLKRLTDAHLSWPVQQAMLTMLKEGHLDRHVRRLRGHYASKCRLLVELLAPLAPHIRVYGADAGVHLYVQCRPELDLQRVKQAAYEHGIIVTTVNEYCIEQPQHAGLFVGYGSLEPQHMMRGAKILVEILRQFLESPEQECGLPPAQPQR